MLAVSGMTPAHLTLGVNDLDASERFYRDILDFPVERRDDALAIAFGSFALVFESAPPTERAKLVLGFRVDDAALDDIVARVQRDGVGRVLAGPSEDAEGKRTALVMDPDQYQLEIRSR